jgi:hypothetical protein
VNAFHLRRWARKAAATARLCRLDATRESSDKLRTVVSGVLPGVRTMQTRPPLLGHAARNGVRPVTVNCWKRRVRREHACDRMPVACIVQRSSLARGAVRCPDHHGKTGCKGCRRCTHSLIMSKFSFDAATSFVISRQPAASSAFLKRDFHHRRSSGVLRPCQSQRGCCHTTTALY